MLIAGRSIEGIGLGTAQFAFRNGTPQDSEATVHAAVDAGVTLIDTALAYTRAGVESYAEQVVAQALRGITGEHPLVATKGGHWRDGDSLPIDGRPDTLRAHCEISLRTLGVDRIGLYQLHHVDPAVPLLDSVGALEQLRQDGKITALGLSNVTVAQPDEALAAAPSPRSRITSRMDILVTCQLPWPAPGAASPTWRTRHSPGHQAGRPKPRLTSPGGAVCPYTGSCWRGCGLSHRTSSRSPVPAGLPRVPTRRPCLTLLTRTWRTCAPAARTSFDLVKVQEKPFKARPIPLPSASGWYGWCEYR